MKKTYKLIFRLLMSGIFAGYLAVKLDWSYLLKLFLEVDFWDYLLSTIFAFFPALILAVKHYLLIRGTSLDLSIFSLFKINMVTRYYALFIPTALGTETVRWYGVTKNEKGRSLFLASIMFERISFLFILILLGLLPLFFNQNYEGVIQLRRQLSSILGIALAFSVILIAYFMSPVAQGVLVRLLDKLPNLGLIKRLAEKIRLTNLSLRVLIYILGLHVVFLVFFQIRVFLIFESLGLNVSFLDVAWMSALVLLLQALPVTFAGIGLREGAYAYLFTLFLLPPEKGVVVGLLIFTQIIILAVAGWLMDWFGHGAPANHPVDPDSTTLTSAP
jgi:uncharacterized protein (TIRG00374 family)